MDYKAFTIQAHGDQTYGDGVPYCVHLQAVQDKVLQYTDAQEVVQAAYMHDILEDTSVTFDQLKSLVGDEITMLVDLVTDRPGANRKERHLNTYWRIRTDPRAVLIKLADRFCNHQSSLDNQLASMKHMYAKEYMHFKFALFQPNQHDKLWAELDAQYEKIK